MQETNISWTDFSANLLKYRDAQGKTVWGCAKVSEGCRNCYSERLTLRWGRGSAFTAENIKTLTPFFDLSEAKQILNSKKIAGKKVFIDDMTDLFGHWVPDTIIDRHFALFALRPDVTFQVLTKRAKRMRDYMSDEYRHQSVELRADEMLLKLADLGTFVPDWPLPNVHLGVSCEDQTTFNERWALLQQTPATVRWLSIEPLLGPIDGQQEFFEYLDEFIWPDWAVVGGESGAGHRQMPLEAALSIIDQLRFLGCPVFVKQDSGPKPGRQGRIPDSHWIKEFPREVSDAKEPTN